jgi:hypothetical protein
MHSAHPMKEYSKPERNTGNFELHMAKKNQLLYTENKTVTTLKKLVPIMTENKFTKNPQFSLLVTSTSVLNQKHKYSENT